jgi:hypothetical protein
MSDGMGMHQVLEAQQKRNFWDGHSRDLVVCVPAQICWVACVGAGVLTALALLFFIAK